jgi:Flp pilus assembly protein TadD
VNVRYVACVLVSMAVTGCASRQLAQQPGRVPAAAALATAAAVPADSLEAYMGKVRQLSIANRPNRPALQTLEGADPRLSTAIALAIVAPSAEAYRRVADEYRRVQVFDKAHEYLNRARLLDARDGATYDAMARLWRDAGFPQLALSDAHRAVYFAPSSPIARNTLGTVLQALGKRELARQQYEQALRLDAQAAYALNNLCYGWVLDGNGSKAVAACERAMAIQPDLTAARHNLALAKAVNGDTAGAQDMFASGNDRAMALYNTGIMHLAQRRYTQAVDAFEAAHVARPGMTRALARARQAQAASAAAVEE